MFSLGLLLFEMKVKGKSFVWQLLLGRLRVAVALTPFT
jgi:hypothetical protein